MNGEDPERIAGGLSEILGVDREKILTMTADRRSWYKTVKRQIEETEADAVRAFKNEYDLQGVKLEPDTKRYYPYASLASHVIGFVGADNTGLSGLEFTQNDLLTGTAGSILRLKNSAGTDMILTSYEDYVDAQNGLDLHLTIDTTVQYYLEKQLSQAVQDYDIQNGAAGIIMDPKTGAILAMASLGNFDLNNYQRVSADVQSEIDAAADPDAAAVDDRVGGMEQAVGALIRSRHTGYVVDPGVGEHIALVDLGGVAHQTEDVVVLAGDQGDIEALLFKAVHDLFQFFLRGAFFRRNDHLLAFLSLLSTCQPLSLLRRLRGFFPYCTICDCAPPSSRSSCTR